MKKTILAIATAICVSAVPIAILCQSSAPVIKAADGRAEEPSHAIRTRRSAPESAGSPASDAGPSSHRGEARLHREALAERGIPASSQSPRTPPSTGESAPATGGRRRILESVPLRPGEHAAISIRPGTPVSVALRESGYLAELPPGERSAVEKANKRFESSLGDPAARDPDSPEYFNRWHSGVDLADEMLRAALGWERYNQLSGVLAGNK